MWLGRRVKLLNTINTTENTTRNPRVVLILLRKFNFAMELLIRCQRDGGLGVAGLELLIDSGS